MLFHDYLKNKLNNLICEEFLTNGIQETPDESSFNIEIPSNKKFGDVSSNIAMIFSKKLNLKPRELADKLFIQLNEDKFIEKLEVVGPGFLNIFFKESFWQNQLKEVARNIKIYKYKITKKKICLEFVSANPTGLMHIGHARGAVLGDTIASILEEVGHDVTREYYINDAGEQIKKLINTIIFHHKNLTNKKINDDKNLYPGTYLKEISDAVYKNNLGKELSDYNFEKKIIDLIINDIKKDLKVIKVNHSSFVSERRISSKENVDKVLKRLKNKNLIYEGFQERPRSANNENWKKDKLLLFKSQKLGDDNDRALMKPNGDLTYFMSDIIYHQNKIDKNYDILLNIWGVDHSGYVKRLENALKELNIKKKYSFEVKLTSLVNLLEGKKIMKMSKRDGNYVTMREVVEKVGSDALRFMMISRNVDKKIDFDFKVIKSKTKENPVFYVQYAYARCMSLIEAFKRTFDCPSKKIDINNADLSFLDFDEDKVLIIKLSNFFNVIIASSKSYEPHKIANYLYDLAKDFHAYWGLGKLDPSRKIISDNNYEISFSRISLVYVISLIIKRGLEILKIDCPENM